jgi:hypothetical protein
MNSTSQDHLIYPGKVESVVSEWWSGIPTFERIFWFFAIPFTLVFLIRLAASLMGFGGSDEDGDFSDSGDFGDGDGDGGNFLSDFRLFTLQNFLIFFTGFGWAGIYAINAGFSPAVTIVVAFSVGALLMFAVAAMYYLINRLTESGNINLNNAVNATGHVYLPIPAQRSGTGQVQITVQGSLREIEAMTDGDALPTGTPVRVIAALSQDVLIVDKSR